MSDREPWELSAVEAAAQIKAGALTSRELVDACLARIEATDGAIGAWVALDADHARAQADAMDDLRRFGKPVGALHGVPVGIKDIFDTVDMPTCFGTPIHEGRQPEADSAVARKLREAGCVILGKTVSTEFAFMHPAATVNPHDLKRTPGGSSSGSAAAVAAGHVPAAIGSQTNGSTIRPASFCGVYGLKPSRGIVSRGGALQTSKTLDQVGVFGRSLADVGTLTDTLAGCDPADPTTYARPKPALFKGAHDDVPVEPLFAWFDLPYADRLDEASREAFEDVIATLGGQVERFPAPESFPDLIAYHKVIHEYEICRHLKDDLEGHWDRVSDTLKPVIEQARTLSDDQYAEAIGMVGAAEGYFAELFNDVDAVLTPASQGIAPLMSAGTGDPVFCTVWTMAGLPCVTLPLLGGEDGLPIGIQLVGSMEQDDRLLRTANWMQSYLEGDASQEEQG